MPLTAHHSNVKDSVSPMKGPPSTTGSLPTSVALTRLRVTGPLAPAYFNLSQAAASGV